MKLYRGIVVNNNDPKKSGRVQVNIFEINGLIPEFSESKYKTFEISGEEAKSENTAKNLPWAEVIQPLDYIGFFNTNHYDNNEKPKANVDGSGSKSSKSRNLKRSKGNRVGGFGYNITLEIGTWVYVIFNDDDNSFQFPIIIGCIAAENEFNENSTPTNKRVYQSTSGHYEEWNDTPGKECIIQHHRSGTEVEMTNDGSLEKQVVKDNKEYIIGKDIKQVDSDKISKVEGSQIEKVQGDVVEQYQGSQLTKVSGAVRINADGKIFLNC